MKQLAFIFEQPSYVVDPHWIFSSEAIQMRTNDTYFTENGKLVLEKHAHCLCLSTTCPAIN